MIDWNSLWNNSRFIDNILYKINQLLKYSYFIHTINTMLLLESSGKPYSSFQLFEFSPQIMVFIE